MIGIALTVAGLFAGTTTWSTPAPDSRELLDKVNDERSSRGLPELTWNSVLAGLAQDHARDMLKAGKLTHATSKDGTTYAGRLAHTDLRVIVAAENIALDTHVGGAHRGLMNSPGHRKNILDPELAEIGIGIVRTQDGRQLYVVQDFATLMPGQTDKQALEALQDALHRVWQQTPVRLQEDGKLSRHLKTAVQRMVRTDTVDAGGISYPGPVWVFTYTTVRPAQLPAEVRTHAGRNRSYGAALTFQRSPSAPFGVYWVALALSQPVKPPEDSP